MIFDIFTKNEIDRIPHKREFDLWRSRLTDSEFNAIVNEINSKITGSEVHTAGWMPGHNWAGTVYEPIYTKACNCDENLSGMCFGLFVWYVFKTRNDGWYSGKFENNGIPIGSMTYFGKKD